MAKWKEALSKTRSVFRNPFGKIFGGGDSAEALEALEAALYHADVNPRLALALIDALGKPGKEQTQQEALRDVLIERLDSGPAFDWSALPKPGCIMLVGINGGGKTTTTAKLARMLIRNGRTPLLGAADTFRAAGSSQLKLWGEKVGCDVVTGKQGADASAVAYDSIDSGIAKGVDAVLIDTAGRMHTKGPLMEELKKMHRAMGKRLEDAPHEVWVVLDASIGQNAIQQARVFHESVPLTGIIVTKLDGSSKAGFLFSVKEELNVPIRYVGLGEGEDDLVAFDAAEFVDGLLGIEAPIAE